jgi:hypothetical protein
MRGPCLVCSKKVATHQARTCSIACRDRLNLLKTRSNAVLPPAVEGARWIVLTAGKFALVDEEMFDELEAMQPWLAHLTDGGYYAVKRPRRHPRKPMVWMHKVVLGAPKGQQVDHRNLDSLDNRRENLRLATAAQNNANRRKHTRADATSNYKGVGRAPGSRNPWRATITVDDRTLMIGTFSAEIDAARAYDVAARKYFGEFARLNFESDRKLTADIKKATPPGRVFIDHVVIGVKSAYSCEESKLYKVKD